MAKDEQADILGRLDERSKTHGEQLDTIHAMMNNGGCARGKVNAKSIAWMYCLGALIIGIIGFLHK